MNNNDSADLESTLKNEELQSIRDNEINRILNQFKLDYYSILNIQPGISQDDIGKLFKRKSLLIHPDKNRDNKNSVVAFDLLKKSTEILLNDKTEKEKLDEIYINARNFLIKEKNWNIDDNRLVGSTFLGEWRLKVKDLLIELEFVKKLEFKKQQLKLSKEKTDEINNIELNNINNKLNSSWNENIDSRIKSWRSYSNKVDKVKKKKKGQKKNVLI